MRRPLEGIIQNLTKLMEQRRAVSAFPEKSGDQNFVVSGEIAESVRYELCAKGIGHSFRKCWPNDPDGNYGEFVFLDVDLTEATMLKFRFSEQIRLLPAKGAE